MNKGKSSRHRLNWSSLINTIELITPQTAIACIVNERFICTLKSTTYFYKNGVFLNVRIENLSLVKDENGQMEK